jgi:TRAP-type C4-dicarboxylate transport system permease small subunit
VTDSEEAPPKPFADDPPIARAVRLADTWLGRAEQVALVVLGVFLVFVCILWFFTENLAEKPLENASADVRYTVYLMAMIGGAYATHHRRLLSMDVINRMVHGKSQAWLRVATTVFAVVITAVFFWYSLDLYLDTKKENSIEHWMPSSAAKSAMMIGSALITLHLLVQLVIDLDYLARGKTPPAPEQGAA